MRSLLLLALVESVVNAQYLVTSSSFGQDKTISPNKFGVPGWHLSGEQYTPQQLSDKVVLTPPYPGNRRGALWAEASVAQSEWTADFEFRATGPERGGGNLQLWYAKGGRSQVGTSSIYTIGKFDGMVLVVDTYGGRGGSIRGFLNDGNTDFKNHHAVDSLAFGHCDYPYRNLGRPSHIQIKQEGNSFEVKVDDRPCFQSDKIKLPTDYHFGISAASAETPDTFEVFKFLLTTTTAYAREEPRRNPPSIPQQQQQQPVGQMEQPQQQNPNQPVQDTPASSITSQDAQFTDLHDRIQKMSHSIDNLFREFSKLASQAEQRHAEMMRKSSSSDQLGGVKEKLDSMERTLNAVQRDVGGKFDKLHNSLKDSHNNILEGLPQTMTQIVSTGSPRMGRFIFIVIVFQLLLAGSYIVYKRRRANGPKKYL
ncbi:hypothetical protein MMC06_003025 [Schaereria dolodes]|nr:hypothetical protein [Schaereria dolodes]